jgi:hypothetical protein
MNWYFSTICCSYWLKQSSNQLKWVLYFIYQKYHYDAHMHVALFGIASIVCKAINSNTYQLPSVKVWKKDIFMIFNYLRCWNVHETTMLIFSDMFKSWRECSVTYNYKNIWCGSTWNNSIATYSFIPCVYTDVSLALRTFILTYAYHCMKCFCLKWLHRHVFIHTVCEY